MAKVLNRLSALAVARQNLPGLYADGGGLYLRISAGKNHGKRWIFLYRRPSDGKRCEIGFGSTSSTPVAVARTKAAAARVSLSNGIDPRLIRPTPQQSIPTFGELADRVVIELSQGWKNDKHKAQWGMTLREYARSIRAIPVDQITTADVLEILRPIWLVKPETASRVRGRIERVLDVAKVEGFRSGENPAAWRGHLALILPHVQKIERSHHARLELDRMSEFMTKLNSQPSISARCLEFAILTAARSGEALEAKWSEVDLINKVWSLPGARMKAGRSHRIPLSSRAIALLTRMQMVRTSEFVFPGQRGARPLSSMALAMVLRRMGEKVTVHGFRSCFRDWAGDHSNYPRELAELSLAHQIGDKAEQAYRRSDALERRRPLMEDWALYCFLGGEQ